MDENTRQSFMDENSRQSFIDEKSRQSFFETEATEEEGNWEQSLRPQTLEEFMGQDRTVKNLKIYIEAARQRGDVLDHILFSGSPGLGKTTLANLIALEMGVNIKITSGPVLERPGDLAGLLTSLERGDVLFIDEIHRLRTIIEEYLYSAMEDFCLDIMIDQGPSARSIRLTVPAFTLVGATTREGLLSAPFRSRFGVLEKMKLYPPEVLKQIILRTCGILDVKIDDDAADLLSERSRGTPRIANRIVRRIRDLAQVSEAKKINQDIALEGLEMLGIDHQGLEFMDRKILETIIQHGGGPVGLKTIAVSVGEEERTLEDVYEPYLIQNGFLNKTPRGRSASQKAYQHLEVDLEDGQKRMF